MDNVYDIRIQEQHLYIRSLKNHSFVASKELLNSVAIAVNLYYEETCQKYYSYLENIPEEVTICVISSREAILESAREHFKNREKMLYLSKENRGRDISALLIVFREIAIQYKYICFVHDKKSRYKYLKKDVDFWIRNLWENTIGSREYIQNILEIFENSKEIGVLAPPEPMGEYAYQWYKEAWGENYDLTCELARRLHLRCAIDKNKPPITLGTVFWAKTEALKKLFDINWKYDDFLPEPLPEDGTLSHAVERILAYVAQDADYKTGTVMSEDYAETMLLMLQNGVRETYRVLEEKIHIHSMYHIKHLEEQKKEIIRFFREYSKVFLYGAGKYGRELLEIIRNEYGLEPEGFVVSDGQKKDLCISGLSVWEISMIEPTSNVGIIIATNNALLEEIEKILIMRGHENYMKWYK